MAVSWAVTFKPLGHGEASGAFCERQESMIFPDKKKVSCKHPLQEKILLDYLYTHISKNSVWMVLGWE